LVVVDDCCCSPDDEVSIRFGAQTDSMNNRCVTCILSASLTAVASARGHPGCAHVANIDESSF
jgi:hypothetical protein